MCYCTIQCRDFVDFFINNSYRIIINIIVVVTVNATATAAATARSSFGLVTSLAAPTTPSALVTSNTTETVVIVVFVTAVVIATVFAYNVIQLTIIFKFGTWKIK